MMRISFAILASTLMLSACDNVIETARNVAQPEVTLDYSFVSGIGGFRNSSLAPGTLFFWDAGTGTLVELDELDMQLGGNANGPTLRQLGTIRSEGLQGVGVRVGGSEIANVNLTGTISRRLAIVAEDLEVQDYKRIISVLSANYVDMGGAAQDIDRKWRLRDAAANSRKHLVLVTDILLTPRSQISLGGSDGEAQIAEAALEVAGIKFGEATLQRLRKFECGGTTPAPCFFKVSVLDPFFTERDGETVVDFKTASFANADLARAFRNR